MNIAAEMSQLPENFITGVATEYGVTKTELEALLLALNNWSGAEIAAKLKISQPAVRKRLGESYRKLGIEGTGNKKINNLRQKLAAQYQASPDNFVSLREDWGEAVDVAGFRGRNEELLELEQWIVGDGQSPAEGDRAHRCRLVTVLGMGGIGKTVIAAKIAKKVQPNFDYLIWRSLRNAPQLGDVLTQLLRFLPNDAEAYAADSDNNKILRLIDSLRKNRCLVILDNVESVLRSGEGKTHEQAGEYQPGYENYGYLFKKVAEAAHQSCLLLTSREKPKEVAALEGKNLPVKVLQLSSLNLDEARVILLDKGCYCSDQQLNELVKRYSGNPLALKIVATTVYDLFSNDMAEFLLQIEQASAVYGDIRTLLDQQFNRLSELEKKLMYWLAIRREYVSLREVREDLATTEPVFKILEVVESLLRRSLIEKEANNSRFRQPSVVMEYVTERLHEQAIMEISQKKKIDFINTYPLMKARSLDYVRQAQERLILEPVKDELLTIFGKNLESHLWRMLETLRQESPLKKGYAAGNLINLLRQLHKDQPQVNLSGGDFGDLTIWQAYFKDVNLQNTNFSNSDLTGSVFTETMSSLVSVRFSPDGQFFATGLMNGEIRLWQTSDTKQLHIYRGHTAWVWAFTFSPDSKTLVSGSADNTIKVWNIATGECQRTLKEHKNKVYSVAFSPDGRILASASEDETIKLWDLTTDNSLQTLDGHTDCVWSVTFQPSTLTENTPLLLASGSADSKIKLWDINTGECVKTFKGHSGDVRSVAFSPNGQKLASSSEDKTVKLWDINTGQCEQTFTGHTKKIYSVRFNPNGETLASCGEDRTIRLWNIRLGECCQILEGHYSQVWAIAYSLDGRTLISCSDDQTAMLWDVANGIRLNTLQGYTRDVYSVAFHPKNSQILASGRDDYTIGLWNWQTEQCHSLREHQGRIRSVAFHPNGQILASGSADNTIKLWDIQDIHRSKCIKTLSGHSNWVWTVVFSPDGQTIASSSEDRSIRLWDVNTGECLQKLTGHSNWVWTVAFSPDGKTLASGAADSEVKLWDVATCQCIQTFTDHTDMIWSVAFSPDGKFLASGSEDKTVKLWNLRTGECSQIFKEHTKPVYSVAFSPNGQILASSSADSTVKLWHINTNCWDTLNHKHTAGIRALAFSHDSQWLASGSEDEKIHLWDVQKCSRVRSLKSNRLYEQMKITGITGMTEAEKSSLIMLGAV
ncbi:NB-ARC domain-containing protein [Nodularia sp. NIES-3585]|uniref:WD40 domain-containing protein n=1 Tax=Nodularia sp. NIES-3585 TaxID=1973477 RepID=UPI000B5C64C9|nr:NB-ARC domain-containing protein [Nodularia sp. NIES-3585]GAX37046.1 putative Transcriptional Regulator, Fis family protein [Nodularia sp. NIES-3585]